ncbi:PQ loop repeat-domain-containing protein, partial [Gilbertella persicaria]|uniref:PQ loop repeat-domain-containing protein n=1 Tax=Gilbertella persicaria TaxID=101096 RepID=UPI002221041E
MPTSEAIASFFGYLSIFCWIVVFTPQFKENYTRKNTDGVSITFLSLWILGDILNLLGIILENLLFTMLLLALYYLLADCLLMTQVFYYRTMYPKQPVEEVVATGSDHERTPLLHKTPNKQTRYIVRIFFVSSLLLWISLLAGSGLFFFWPREGHHIDLSQWHLVPQLLGWGSAILYCSSRIPQIMQNFKNESVEGLSLSMFIFSVVGNLTYCVSIVLDSTDPTYLLINYPWLLGSGGTLFFDFTVS